MARFRATCEGRGTEASRLGSTATGATARANGWSIGGRVDVNAADVERTPGGRVKADGTDVVSVTITGGSGNGSGILALGDWARDESGRIVPRDAVAHVIARALTRERRRVEMLTGGASATASGLEGVRP